MVDPVDLEAVKNALGSFPTGVTLVTTVHEGAHQGLTANSFTSVSLEPLLVLVCVQRSARFHDLVLASGRWGVSVLSDRLEEVSRIFAVHGRAWTEDQFAPFPHRVGEASGCLLLTEAAATFECATLATAPGGDHTIVIGEVLAFAAGPPGAAPLVYAGGNYRRLPPLRPGEGRKA
jgi:flavin reductase (DIM6/NTAB) family NADH-FMN oxidoreductase RutF